MTRKTPRRLVVYYVLSYREPNYIRTKNLIAMLATLPDVELHLVRNTRKGVGRYLETLWKLLRLRGRAKPDWIVLGFRGTEIYPFVKLLSGGTPILFDAMMSPTLALREERGGWAHLLSYLLYPIERKILHSATHLLTDTANHAAALQTFYNLPPRHILTIPIAADESSVLPAQPSRQIQKRHLVLYYGSFLPLHGLEVLLEAMTRVRHKAMQFVFIGIGERQRAVLRAYAHRLRGVQLETISYLPFERLMQEYVAQCWLFLGGPFGGTPQAQRVVTGKTVQALYFGLPCVVGLNAESEPLRARRACLTVPQRNPQALADTLDWAYTHAEALCEIAANGRAYYWEHYAIACGGKRLGEFLRNATT